MLSTVFCTVFHTPKDCVTVSVDYQSIVAEMIGAGSMGQNKIPEMFSLWSKMVNC